MYLNLQEAQAFLELEPKGAKLLTELINTVLTTPTESSSNITARIALQGLNILIDDSFIKDEVTRAIKEYKAKEAIKTSPAEPHAKYVGLSALIKQGEKQGGELAGSIPPSVRAEMIANGYNPLNIEDVIRFSKGLDNTKEMEFLSGVKETNNLGAANEEELIIEEIKA